MNQRLIFHLISILIIFFIEVTIVQILFPPSASLRLLLLIGLSLLFLDYSEEAFWWLIGGGILLDLQSSQVFGLQTFIFLGIYLGVSLFRQRVVHQPNLFLLAGILFISVLIYDLVDWLILTERSYLDLLTIFGWSALINFLFIWPIYLITFYLSKWLDRYHLFTKREELDVKKTL